MSRIRFAVIGDIASLGDLYYPDTAEKTSAHEKVLVWLSAKFAKTNMTSRSN
jgi:hypothetical protein